MASSEEIKVVLPASIWGQIVFRVKEMDDDPYLRQLVEQAVAEAGSLDIAWRPTT